MTYNQKEATTHFSYELFTASPESRIEMMKLLDQQISEWERLIPAAQKMDLNQLIQSRK